MNNENLEDKVLNKNNSSSARIFYIIAGLLILGVVSLYGGIKIFSNLQISADTSEEPPVPADPFVSPNAQISPSVVPSNEPPLPPDVCKTPLTLTFPSGWSMINGSNMESRDVSEISKHNIYIYSYNDPSPGLQTRAWVASDPFFTTQGDYFRVGTKNMWLQKFSGYYAYNPGSQVKITFNCTTVTNPASSTAQNTLVYGRGWHLMYWPGGAQTKDQLLANYHIFYADKTSLSGTQAISQAQHKASIKIYVVVNQNGVAGNSIKELTGTDSATTISKIPSNSYFWMYLRRTKSRSTLIAPLTAQNVSVTPTPSATASSDGDGPPTPPAAN